METAGFASADELLLAWRTREPVYCIYPPHIYRDTARAFLHDKILATATPGEIVGEMALINSDIRSATATAMTDCLMASIDQSSFDALLRHVPEFTTHVMNVLADRLKVAYQMLEH